MTCEVNSRDIECVARSICSAVCIPPDRIKKGTTAPEWAAFIAEAKYVISIFRVVQGIPPVIAWNIIGRSEAYILRAYHEDRTWTDVHPARGILSVKGDC